MAKYLLFAIAGLGLSAAVYATDFRDPVLKPDASAKSCVPYQDNGTTGEFCRSLKTEQQCKNYSTLCQWSQRP